MIIHIFPEDFSPLPVYFVSLASHHLQETVNRPDGFRDICQLLFVLDGEGVLYCEGAQYRLKRGCAFYIEPGVGHRYEGGEGFATAWVTYRGSGCEDLHAYVGKKSFLFFESTDVKKYALLLEKMEKEYFEGRRQGVLSADLYALLLSFFERCEVETVSDMDRVLRYMEEHFGERLTVSELCALIHCSKSSFCKNFKLAFDCTAFEKLLEIRLLNARSMLRFNPEEKVGLIAKRCGFDDVSYFCKAYKKRFLRTPAEDRK